jgi:DNA-binding transcriptional regulator YiaG
MAHPNRSTRTTDDPRRNPTPEQIREAREAAGLSQTEAALLVYANVARWISWETGERRCHPAFFELFCMKSRALKVPA